MALGNMNYEDARQCATDLGTTANDMRTNFKELQNEMNSLEEVLKSKGADELYATYKSLETKLEGFPGKVDAFKDYINKSVEAYEANDATLASQANG